MSRIKRLLIVGGTHGNELTGVYLVRKWKQCPELIHRPSFETMTLLGNPRAVILGTRYLDRDLNRCFASQMTEKAGIADLKYEFFVESGTLRGSQQKIHTRIQQRQKANHLEYEMQRAEEIRQEFGSLGSTPADFIIDLHSTTSNAGLMLILDNLDFFTLNLSAYLKLQQPDIKIYCSEGSGRRQDSVRSLAPHRMGIEVGPIAHGTLHGELLQKTEALIYMILDYFEQCHHNPQTTETAWLQIYQYVDTVDYPRDENGEILAMVHPQLQFKDYEALNPGDPMFLTFNGESLTYQGDATVYPVFINEAAYYEKGIAMCLTQTRQLAIQDSPI